LSIPINQYFIVTTTSNFKSKVEAQLAGVDYFFLIANNGDLIVKTFTGTVSYTLAVNVKWVDVIPASDRLHIYWADTSSKVFHLVWEHFGAGDLVPVDTGIVDALLTFSVNYAANSVPPAYLMITDDGEEHTLYVASDPDFHIILATRRVFTNLVDPAHFVTRPTISIHPTDIDVITVHCQQVRVSDDQSKTGFYTLKIPGVA
jgi:hypothetical protein